MQKVKRPSARCREHLTTRLAAAHCRVSIPTLRRWIRAGELGAHLTPGGHRRIALDEFQRFLRAQGRPAYPVGPEPRTRVLLVDDEPLVVQMLHDLLIDDIVPGSALRDELLKRLAFAQTKAHEFPPRRNGVYPV